MKNKRLADAILGASALSEVRALVATGDTDRPFSFAEALLGRDVMRCLEGHMADLEPVDPVLDRALRGSPVDALEKALDALDVNPEAAERWALMACRHGDAVALEITCAAYVRGALPEMDEDAAKIVLAKTLIQ